MRKIALVLLALFAFAAAMANANADLVVGAGTSDLSFQIYKGNSWNYAPVPYTYNFGNWQYYEYPYRYFYDGDWHSFEPGWYYSYPGWYYAPPEWRQYYNYYPPDYYYNLGRWYYQPDWYSNYYITSYYTAKNFYSNYYAPYLPSYYSYSPSYYPYNSYSSYGSATYAAYYAPYAPYRGTSSYGYPQIADCGEIALEARDIGIDAGETESAEVEITNNSRMDFSITSASVYIDSFDLQQRDLEYASSIAAGSKRSITFTVSADDDAKSAPVPANIQVAGQFADGTSCNYDDIGKELFTVSVTAKPLMQEPEPVPEQTGFAYSSSTIVPRNAETSTWHETYPAQAQQSLQSSNQMVRLSSPAAPLCSALGIVAENITVDAGSKAYKDFYIKNYSGEKFYIDGIEVKDYSDAFTAGRGLADSFIFENSTGKATVVVDALPSSKDTYATAAVRVDGHFESGNSCSITEQFYVYVETPGQPKCSAFKIEVPEEITFSNGAAARITIDNPLPESAAVAITARNAEVTPAFVRISPETYAERIIYVESIEGSTAWITYTASVGGCAAVEKFTRVVGSGAGQAQEAVEIALISYPQEIAVEGSRELAVVVANSSGSAARVLAELTGLPQGFYVRNAEAEIAPNESRQISIVIFESGVADGMYSAVLRLSSDGFVLSRNVSVIIGSGQTGVSGTETAQPSGTGSGAGSTGSAAVGSISGALATAFVVVGNNALGLIGVVIVIVVAYALYRTATHKGSEGALAVEKENSADSARASRLERRREMRRAERSSSAKDAKEPEPADAPSNFEEEY